MAKGRDASPRPSGATALDAKPGRLKQVKMAYGMAREADPTLPWVLLSVFLGVVLVAAVLGLVLDHPILFTLFGLLLGALVTLIVFGKRAERAAYASVEGQVGAAAGVLQNMRGRWTVTPAVAVTRAQDVVHRVIGRPGVILVGEGAPTRLASLFAQERKKIARVSPDVPITEFIVGTGEGQVPLRLLQRKLMKLPRTVAPAQVAEADRRLKALGERNMPIPKGPLPKGMKMPKGPAPR